MSVVYSFKFVQSDELYFYVTGSRFINISSLVLLRLRGLHRIKFFPSPVPLAPRINRDMLGAQMSKVKAT